MSNPIRRAVVLTAAALPLCIFNVHSGVAQDLSSFAVVSGQSLTNTGPTTIIGNIAISPGSTYTGSGEVAQTGETFLADAVAGRIQNDLTTLYTYLAGAPTSAGGDLTGQDLGGLTLTAGVYNFDTSAGLTAGQTLTLDGGGDTDAIFIFNIGSTLTVGSDAQIILQNGAQGGNVFYRIGSSATLDTTAAFQGQIVALTSVTLNTSATIGCGAAFARGGSVTLDSNTIQICTLAAGGFDVPLDNPSLTQNELNTAKVLSDYVGNGGVLPIGIAILAATQTPEELAESLAQLSGEVSTGVAPLGMQSMDAFLDTVLSSGLTPRVQVAGIPDQGGMYVPEEEYVGGKYGSTQTAESRQQPSTVSFAAASPTQSWGIWGAGYGRRKTTEGDAANGTNERTSDVRGLAFGLDFFPDDSTSFGVAVSKNTGSFDLANGFGTGTSDALLIAFHARKSSGKGYVEGALAFGRVDMTTDRTVTTAGQDHFTAQTTADTLAAHIEAGYHMGIFTPFAAVRAQRFSTPAYSETTVSGSSSYALNHDEQTTNSVRSELGVRMQLAGSDNSAFGIRAAWAHEFASYEPGTSSFQSIPGVSFPVSGATQDRDSLILAAGAEFGASEGIYGGVAVNTEYSRNSKDYGGSLKVGYRW